MMKKTIYIFRHGETEWNRLRRLQGVQDIPLNETGQKQADGLKAFFQKNPVDAWFSSPLSRARETLERACLPPAGQVTIIPRLAEVQLGELEGLMETEMNSKFSAEDLAKWRGNEDLKFAFSGAESANVSNQRLQKALEEIVQFSFTKAAICSHGFLMRRFLHQLMPREQGFRVPNARVFTLQWDEDKKTFFDISPDPMGEC